MSTGYADRAYAASFAEFGEPRHLPASDGWLLTRAIPGSAARDAMGAYPLFACRDWRALGADLRAIDRELISVVLVADPFGDHDVDLLARAFNAGAIPFKEHQVVDFASGSLESIVSSHHRRNVRKAVRAVHAEPIADPRTALDDWCRLYANLVARHEIRGISAFSRAAFAAQLAAPGALAFRAVLSGETVGMLLFYSQGPVAYYHLGAYEDRGYESGAAFALFWTALGHLRETHRYVSLGGDAGLGGEGGGLARFKRGWANATRPAFLCRHVCDAARYAELSRGHETSFFPAYRSGEVAPREEPAEEGAHG